MNMRKIFAAVLACGLILASASCEGRDLVSSSPVVSEPQDVLSVAPVVSDTPSVSVQPEFIDGKLPQSDDRLLELLGNIMLGVGKNFEGAPDTMGILGALSCAVGAGDTGSLLKAYYGFKDQDGRGVVLTMEQLRQVFADVFTAKVLPPVFALDEEHTSSSGGAWFPLGSGAAQKIRIATVKRSSRDPDLYLVTVEQSSAACDPDVQGDVFVLMAQAEVLLRTAEDSFYGYTVSAMRNYTMAGGE